MAIPSTGSCSLSTIQAEFGGSNPTSLSEYYAGGAYVPSGTTGNLGAIPTSGTISVDHFRGSSNIPNGLSSWAYRGKTTTTGSGTNKSGSVAIGTANAARWVAVYVAIYSPSGATNFNTATIGGVSATRAYRASNAFFSAAVFFAKVPSGTTATVALTLSASSTQQVHIFSYSGLVGGGNLKAIGTGSQLSTSTVAINATQSGGIAIAANHRSGATTSGWSGATYNANSTLDGYTVSCGSNLNTNGNALNINTGNTTFLIIGVSLGV
jgi:hypothetical protein